MKNQREMTIRNIAEESARVMVKTMTARVMVTTMTARKMLMETKNTTHQKLNLKELSKKICRESKKKKNKTPKKKYQTLCSPHGLSNKNTKRRTTL